MLFAHCMYTVIKKLLVCKKTIVKIIPYKNNVQKDTDFCDKNVCGKFENNLFQQLITCHSC